MTRLEFLHIAYAERLGISPAYETGTETVPRIRDHEFPDIHEAADRIFSIPVSVAVWADLMGVEMTADELRKAEKQAAAQKKLDDEMMDKVSKYFAKYLTGKLKNNE